MINPDKFLQNLLSLQKSTQMARVLHEKKITRQLLFLNENKLDCTEGIKMFLFTDDIFMYTGPLVSH